MFVTLSFSNTEPRAQLPLARAPLHPRSRRASRRARSRRAAASSSAGSGTPSIAVKRQRVEKRLARRQQRAGDGRGEPPSRRAPYRAARAAAAARRESSTRCSAPSRRSSAASSTSIGKKSSSRAAGACHANFRYAVVPSRSSSTRRSPICGGSAATRPGRRRAPANRRRNARSARRSTSSRLDVADHDERRVVGNVVAAVVAVQIVARHRPQIVDPADRRMAVRMRAERGRGDLGVEQLVGIVLAALQLRDDDGALGLALAAARTARAPSARPR